ncbi:sensor histidine kinase [Catenulispora pinisilvae]|uniref:sensor histidine kinase n=1 Tax=Catenulispora pinisilvae TaxID=2705253 RepID=UPI0018921DA3|nr:sensor histidine kinase [Catenulispora pinisilvae]
MLRMHDAAKSLASIPRPAQLPPLLADLAIAAAGTWIAVATSVKPHPALASHGGRHIDGIAITLILALGAALILRRRFPLSVLAACAALTAGYEAYNYRLGLTQALLLLAMFTVGARLARPWAALAAAVTYAELLFDHFRSWSGSHLWIWLGTALWVTAVALIADGARQLAESRALLAAYKEQEQRKHRDREQRAVLMERIRIARELHDVTAHHLSVIAVQAGVARFVIDKEPETADQALRAISEVGSEGLAELRRLISLLRPDDDEGARAHTSDPPAPGIAQLPVLIERVGLSGTPSRYTVAGRKRTLPAGIELCVYRVVQESLTNVLKHAPGSSVEVRLEYEPDVVRVTITDTGTHPVSTRRSGIPAAAITQASRHSGSGVGLTGMRERAALYGGELSAGRTLDGGFEVALTLPVESAEMVEVEEEASVPAAGVAVAGA